MDKISWDVAFQNTTFFFVDSSIEAFYENLNSATLLQI